MGNLINPSPCLLEFSNFYTTDNNVILFYWLDKVVLEKINILKITFKLSPKILNLREDYLEYNNHHCLQVEQTLDLRTLSILTPWILAGINIKRN